LNQQVLTEERRLNTQPQIHRIWHNLALADGSHWKITADDEEAETIVSQLGSVMQLSKTIGTIEPSLNGNQRRLHVQVKAPASVADCYIPLAAKSDGVFVSVLCPCKHWNGQYINLLTLSLILARNAQACGGVLVHGALAERDGMGIILAAPGGTGKTTASNRLPVPWRSLCDDTTLVVLDAQGSYWAHPWPTWSRFIDSESGGVWNVQEAVPLKGIFFLEQAVEDNVKRVGAGQAVSLLTECAKQASMFTIGLPEKELRDMYLERFNNLCDLASVVPVHMLDISLTGAFWQKIEQALDKEIINKKKADMG